MNRVLTSIKPVVEQLRHVRINQDKIREFSENFNGNNTKHWMDDAPFDISRMAQEEKTGFLFVFNSISFSYWGSPKWTIEYKGRNYDGAWGMIASLGRAIEEGKPILDSNYLVNIPQRDLEGILRGNVRIPLFEERLEILREVGTKVTGDYCGKFRCIIDEAGRDALRLLGIIAAEFPSFDDSAPYNGRKVFFHKRAQLLISDINHLRDKEEGVGLVNADKLTACADYKLPRVLRKFGILEYSPELADKVDNRREIPARSEEEIEIRSNTIFAVELIKQESHKKGLMLTSSQINDYLWLKGQEKSADDKPYHLTRTIAY